MALSLVRVVIVEDQPTIRKDVTDLLEKMDGFVVVGACGSVKEARTIIPATRPDVLLLDVTLEDGIAFDILQDYTLLPFKVIFLTAFPDHAIQAIKVGAVDYLLKPVDKTELRNALVKVQHTLPAKAAHAGAGHLPFKDQSKFRHIVLRSADYSQIVDLDTIVYCTSDSGYTTFFLTDGKKVITSRYIKEYEELLTASLFIRPHQSYMVNFRFIDRYHNEGHLVLKDGTIIPVATRRREEVKELINNL